MLTPCQTPPRSSTTCLLVTASLGASSCRCVADAVRCCRRSVRYLCGGGAVYAVGALSMRGGGALHAWDVLHIGERAGELEQTPEPRCRLCTLLLLVMVV